MRCHGAFVAVVERLVGGVDLHVVLARLTRGELLNDVEDELALGLQAGDLELGLVVGGVDLLLRGNLGLLQCRLGIGRLFRSIAELEEPPAVTEPGPAVRRPP